MRYLTSQKIAALIYFMEEVRIHDTYYWFIGTAVAQWLRYCATNRKVAGSIPDDVIRIFH